MIDNGLGKITKRAIRNPRLDVSLPIGFPSRIRGWLDRLNSALYVQEVGFLNIFRQHSARLRTLGSLADAGHFFRYQLIKIRRASVAVAIVSELDAFLFLGNYPVHFIVMPISEVP